MSVAEKALDLLAELEETDPSALDDDAAARLAALKRRIGFVNGTRSDREAFALSTTTEPKFVDPESRRGCENALKRLLSARPWRGKIVSRADGGRWTVMAKTYTTIGTVVVYAPRVSDALTLIDAVDPAVAALRVRQEVPA